MAPKAKTETVIRPKTKGNLSKIWDSSAGTVTNSFDVAETFTGTIANTFKLANELLLPNIIEARFDTQVTLQECVIKLTELGADPVDATQYLRKEIM